MAVENPLAKLSKAAILLSEARTLEDVKKIHDIAEAARTYARAAKLGIEAANHAAEIKLRAERKAGEMLAQLEKKPGARMDKPPDRLSGGSEYRTVLEEQDILEKTAERWQSVACIEEPVFEKHIAEVIKSGGELTMAGLLRASSNHHVSDDTYDWFTPKEYIEAARRVMGSIDLDPATCTEANQVVRATKIYTPETDGLSHDWTGNVWLNPPYSTPHISLFLTKLLEAFDAGRVKQAVALTNNSTDTNWFHILAERFPFCLTRGRISFWGHGGEILATRQGQSLFYLGKRVAAFRDEFSQFGIVVNKL